LTNLNQDKKFHYPLALPFFDTQNTSALDKKTVKMLISKISNHGKQSMY